MSSDFTAAQERIQARRRAQAAEALTNRDAQRALHSTNRLTHLPYPLGDLSQKGLQTWDLIRGREGTNPSFRVGQVDSELLDEELLDLLKVQVGEGLKYFGAHLSQDWSAEILLALRAILFKLSIWDNDSSYGAALQGLRYSDARHLGSVPRKPSMWQKGAYGLVTVFGRYGWTRWEEWLTEQDGGYREPSPHVRLWSRITSLASATHDVAALVSFLVFLINGRYRTLLDRILRIRLITPTNQIRREVSFEYLNRQLVWHAFTEFLLFLLPLVGISRWKRWISRAWKKAKALARKDGSDDMDESDTGEFSFLPERTCAICYQDQNPSSSSENEVLAMAHAASGVVGSAQTDITNPYEAIPCEHIYCFVCIATRLEAEEGEGFSCLRCGGEIKECKPWSGDVAEEISRPGTGKSVTFADDAVKTEETKGQDRFDPADDSGYQTGSGNEHGQV